MSRSRRIAGLLAILTVSLAAALAAALIGVSSANAAILSAGNSYSVTTDFGNALVPGTADIGNHCDDCTTGIALPFAFGFYNTAYTTANISSNGVVQFGGTNDNTFESFVLPTFMNTSIFPFWTDLVTGNPGDPGFDCATPGHGIFTSVSGVAPNRIFNIEWRACYFLATLDQANFEVRLFESSNRQIQRFDVVFGGVVNDHVNGGNNAFPTIGSQNDANNWTQDTDWNGLAIPVGTRLMFTLKQSTTTTVSCSPNPANLGQSVTCTATVHPAIGGIPTGTVAFTQDGNPIPGCAARPLNGASPPSATCTFTPATGGAHTIGATYSGDANFLGSSGSTVLNVTSGHLTITKQLVSNPLDPGKFNLQFDFVTKAACVGNNGTTGSIEVPTGFHVVGETACFPTNLSNYVTSISCSDGSFGWGTSLGIFISNTENLTCTIRNQRKLFKV